MAITNATRLSDFAAGIGTEGAILKIDNANQRVGIGTQLPSQMLEVAGIVSATQYIGDGSLLEGITSAGLGTAISDVEGSAGAVVYYTDDLLSVTQNTTINPPASASAAYTQYRDIKLEDSVDLIIETGDDFIPDVLGLSTDSSDPNASGNGVFDEIYSDIIKNKDGLGAPTFANGLTSVGVITATGGFSGNVSGSGANLTNLPAGQLTGALPALDGSALTGVGVGPTVSINTSGIITATTFVPTVGQLSHRNLIINGAMQVAQRGTSSTTAGYKTVDRWSGSLNDVDEAPTFAQHALTSSDTGPWQAGFRYSYHLTNGNQTGGAGSVDKIEISTALEAQDIANSGWDYTSTSSYITLSFWVRSSVAQNFFGHFKTTDGTAYNYPFETGSLTADTWTKVIKTIPGNSNLQFDNNIDAGLTLLLYGFMGTGLTGSVSLNTWAAYNSSTRTPDQTSTWYTTNDSTLEFTGFQLEVGPTNTPFEHRTYAEDLKGCERYCQVFGGDVNFSQFGVGVWKSSTASNQNLQLMTTMRAAPTLTVANPTDSLIRSGGTNITTTTVVLDIASTKMVMYNANAASGGTDGHGAAHFGAGNTNCTLTFSSEL